MDPSLDKELIFTLFAQKVKYLKNQNRNFNTFHLVFTTYSNNRFIGYVTNTSPILDFM